MHNASVNLLLTACARGNKQNASPYEKRRNHPICGFSFSGFRHFVHDETRSRLSREEFQAFRRNHACLAARNKRPNHV